MSVLNYEEIRNQNYSVEITNTAPNRNQIQLTFYKEKIGRPFIYFTHIDASDDLLCLAGVNDYGSDSGQYRDKALEVLDFFMLKDKVERNIANGKIEDRELFVIAKALNHILDLTIQRNHDFFQHDATYNTVERPMFPETEVNARFLSGAGIEPSVENLKLCKAFVDSARRYDDGVVSGYKKPDRLDYDDDSISSFRECFDQVFKDKRKVIRLPNEVDVVENAVKPRRKTSPN